MFDDSMKEALKRKRLKGLEISITVGPNKEDESQKTSDLAPTVKDKMKAQQDTGSAYDPEFPPHNEEQEMNSAALEESHPDAQQDKALFGQMMANENRVQSVNKPMNLKDRAFAMMRNKIKSKE